MIARLALFPIALALMAPAASAQAPDPAALDLARLLMQRDPELYDDADLGRFRSRIEAALLAIEGGCDRSNTECQGAAAVVAAQYAPQLRQTHRETTERLVAADLAARIPPGEMARISGWLRSGEGTRFLEAWEALREPRALRRRREMQGDLARSAPAIFNPARALFRQRIVNIPKAAPR